MHTRYGVNMSQRPRHTILGWTTIIATILLTATIASGEDPPLPPGLSSPAEETAVPALPPGLDAAPKDAPAAPALPPGLDEEPAAETATEAPGKRTLPLDLHGFIDLRGGLRTGHDPAYPRDATLGETRLQLETEKAWDDAVFELTVDFLGDGVLEEADFDLRQARLTWSLTDRLDLRVGRQVLTWGTGDMLFINDLFPKDWQSFFIGRDVEYLKAPSDALKLGCYSDLANVEFVYTPQFNPDRFITGERVSYWNPLFNKFSGYSHRVDSNAQSDWFEDDEFALRIYRNLGNFEVAAYGYAGYWKSPSGQRLIPFMQAVFPKLNVYGASVRGPVGKGILNIEAGYYDSRQDRGGSNLFISNSELRFLLGYEREIAKNFTASLQYYFEHMMDYSAYRNTRLFWTPARDKDRHLFTLRLTKLLMDQNLTLSLFTYYSPTDGDAYLRPRAAYKLNDQWSIELGGNIFLGESESSFFGQFQNNTNIYTGARWSF